MKMFNLIFLSTFFILSLTGCSKEQFGSTPTSSVSSPDTIKSFEQLSCSSYTLIKPKVDILYVVDNSTSSYYVASDIKNAIKNTVDSISKEFDYRVIGTPLILTSNGNENYQLLTNSSDPLSSTVAGHKIISSSEFSFFSELQYGSEKGLDRTLSFINAHKNDGLFRTGAYLLIVLVSNGYDEDIQKALYTNGETSQDRAIYSQRLDSFLDIKSSLESQQLRFFSVTARSVCKSGWRSSQDSYIAMSKSIYLSNGLSETASAYQDNYDLCAGGISSVFTGVNSSIKQVVIPHKYKYWPITATNSDIDPSSLKVFKSSSSSAPVELKSGWQYKANPNYPGAINTRISPSAGEPTTARHLIEFSSGSEVVYPDCVSVTVSSNLEYFGYIVLPQAPKPETIVVRIRGSEISSSSTNGWSYVGYQEKANIKVPYDSYPDLPAVSKKGYMIQLNGKNNYYKSGDSVEVYYLPAGI